MIARNSESRGSRRAGAAPTPPRSACPDCPLARTFGHAIALTSYSAIAFTLRVSVSPARSCFDASVYPLEGLTPVPVSDILDEAGMPKWRNGRRAGLKIRSPQGGVGSSPTFGIIPKAP